MPILEIGGGGGMRRRTNEAQLADRAAVLLGKIGLVYAAPARPLPPRCRPKFRW